MKMHWEEAIIENLFIQDYQYKENDYYFAQSDSNGILPIQIKIHYSVESRKVYDLDNNLISKVHLDWGKSDFDVNWSFGLSEFYGSQLFVAMYHRPVVDQIILFCIDGTFLLDIGHDKLRDSLFYSGSLYDLFK